MEGDSTLSEKFDIALTIKNGWCELSVETDEQAHSFKATFMRNALNNLVDATLALAEGADVACVLWGGEGNAPGANVFLDMSLDHYGNMGVAVHEAEHWTWLQPATKWTPRRGKCLLEAYVPFSGFLVGLTRELQRIRANDTDASAFITQWRHSFPAVKFEALERIGGRHGYIPRSKEELNRLSNP
ncbi:hypothetical protein [Saccharopolyspora sp. NPDC002376]